jgi:hypothetical protein
MRWTDDPAAMEVHECGTEQNGARAAASAPSTAEGGKEILTFELAGRRMGWRSQGPEIIGMLDITRCQTPAFVKGLIIRGKVIRWWICG